jgi:hypothetical protein
MSWKAVFENPATRADNASMKPVSATAQRVLEKLIDGLDVGQSRKIDNASGTFMAVHVERVGEDFFSVAHYFVQQGDMMADPDVVFWRTGGRFYPVEYTQHSLGIYQHLVTFENGRPVRFMARQQADVASFTTTWMRNIKQQQELK